MKNGGKKSQKCYVIKLCHVVTARFIFVCFILPQFSSNDPYIFTHLCVACLCSSLFQRALFPIGRLHPGGPGGGRGLGR